MTQQPPPPPPPPGAYAAPATGQQNGLAIAGMVLGIASVVLFFLTWPATIVAIVGLILSPVGLSKSKQLGGLGRGMAIAGVVTSSIGLVASIIFLIVVAGKIRSGEIVVDMVLVPALSRLSRSG
jgi:Domain of unknown function (DUF4190)